jgi:hypothetical protein
MEGKAEMWNTAILRRNIAGFIAKVGVKRETLAHSFMMMMTQSEVEVEVLVVVVVLCALVIPQ